MRHALDPIGALLSIVGISSLVYGLIEAPDKGWTSGVTLGAFGFAVVVLTVFVFWELRCPEPMLDIRLFRNASFATGSGGMTLTFLAAYGLMFLMSQYLQLVLGYSTLGSALRMLPMAPIMIIVAPLTPRLSARFGANRVVGVGMVFASVGFLTLVFTGLHSGIWLVWIAMGTSGMGMSLTMSPMTAAIMSAVPSSRAGAGSAMNDATRELGAALGVAVLGSVAASQYSSSLSDALGRVPASLHASANASLAGALRVADSLPAAARDALATAAKQAFVDGIHLAAFFGAALALIAAVLTTRFLPRHFVQEGAMHSATASLENVAELGLGGSMPVFPDEPDADEPIADEPIADAPDPAGAPAVDPDPAHDPVAEPLPAGSPAANR